VNVRVARRGPAGKYEMWGRCRDPQRWPSWMAAVRAVDTAGDLRPGLEGTLVLVGGVRVRFDVLEVNALGPAWTGVLRLGPLRLELEHHVDEGFGLVDISGPVLLPLIFVPLARRSLSKLLRRG
jgi:hypothetical protein